MDSKESTHHIFPKMKRKIFIIITLILISIEIILFILIKMEITKTMDIDITFYLQKKLLDTEKNSTNFFLEFNQYLNNIYAPYFLIAIIYNFFTVYDCFILVNVLSIDYIFSFEFKLSYSKPSYKYFGINNNNLDDIRIYYCGYGYAFPSQESIIAVSIYLSIWKIINKASFKYNQKKRIIKYILLSLFIIILFIYNFLALLDGYYYFSHIIFSVILGIIVYLIFFETNILNLLDGKEFMNFINKYNLLYIILNLSSFVFLSIIYIIYRVKISKDTNYGICTDKDGKEFNQIEKYYSYIDGTFVFNILFLGNIFSMVGIILDLKYKHKGNNYTYYTENFTQEYEELINEKNQESFGHSIHIIKDTVWNNTSLLISFLRLIIVIVFWWVCFFPYIFVHFNDKSIALILFIKILLPPILFFMGIFYYLKLILQLMNLTNTALRSLSIDP